MTVDKDEADVRLLYAPAAVPRYTPETLTNDSIFYDRLKPNIIEIKENKWKFEGVGLDPVQLLTYE